MNRNPTKFIEKYLKILETHHAFVLEIGCGPQQYRHCFNNQYFGLDTPDSPCIDPSNMPFFVGKLEELDISLKFDFIFGIASFYMMENAIQNVRRCFDLLNENGKILIFDYRRTSTLQLLKDKNIYVPKQFWNRKQLMEMLRLQGFRDCRDISHIASDYHFVEPESLLGSCADYLSLFARRVLATIKPSQWLIIEAYK